MAKHRLLLRYAAVGVSVARISVTGTIGVRGLSTFAHSAEKPCLPGSDIRGSHGDASPDSIDGRCCRPQSGNVGRDARERARAQVIPLTQGGRDVDVANPLPALKLDGMARAFEEQAALTASTSLSFEERFGMVVDREIAWRDTRRLDRLLKSAKLENPQACVEDIEYRQSRGPDKGIVATLAGCDWMRNAQNLILTGPSEHAT